MIDVLLSNEGGDDVPAAALLNIVRLILHDHGVTQGEISLAVVGDELMRRLNRRYLHHDYSTDVLSFLLDQRPGALDGEIIISADTARRAAAENGCSTADELLLYAAHGALHLVGFDDQTATDRQTMREREAHYLRKLVETTAAADAPDGSTPGPEARTESREAEA